jgi:D-3-phosphoglycerate dehydrogenase
MKAPRFKVLITDYAWPDLSIEQGILGEVGAEVIAAPHPDVETLAELARDASAIMTNWAQVPEAVIAAAPRLKIVARFGIGLDNIDVEAATRRGVIVTNVPNYCLIEVAEHALALLLSLARKVAFFHAQTKSGVYDLQAGPGLRRIQGQTLGIVGYGHIGRVLATKARALGLKIVATGRTPPSDLPPDVAWRSLDDLLGESDYVSLHLPLTPETRHLIGAAELSRMKRGAYLINTARGGLVDHAALVAALASGHLAGAGLDVQEHEPPDLKQPPYNDPRVIVTPHAAFLSAESLAELRDRTARQVASCLAGQQPENVVNPSVARQPS